MFDKVLAKR